MKTSMFTAAIVAISSLSNAVPVHVMTDVEADAEKGVGFLTQEFEPYCDRKF